MINAQAYFERGFLLQRTLFLISVYSGIRALFNRAKGMFSTTPRVTAICGRTIGRPCGDLKHLRVHARSIPRSAADAQSAGMVSVYLETPGVSPLAYRLALCTSHFGCGHLEMAFYETKDYVVIYAIRNILHANLARLGIRGFFASLKLNKVNDEKQTLQEIVFLLESYGFRCRFASPDECVSLAVTPSLLKSRQRDKAIIAIRRNYLRKIRGVVVDETTHDRPLREFNE